jgi:hypothetical protein
MAPTLALARELYALASGVETRLPSASKPMASAIGSELVPFESVHFSETMISEGCRFASTNEALSSRFIRNSSQ